MNTKLLSGLALIVATGCATPTIVEVKDLTKKVKVEEAPKPLWPEGTVRELTGVDISYNISTSPIPVVVDVYAEWCGPCKMLEEPYRRAAKVFAGKMSFARINAEKDPEVTGPFEIAGYPTVLVFNKGEIACRSEGYDGPGEEREFRRFLDACLKEIKK